MAITDTKTEAITFQGRVLAIRCRVDSLMETESHYAIVLTQAGEIQSIYLAGRHWGGAGERVATATIDATAEVIDQAAALVRANTLANEADDALVRMRQIRTGLVVRVASGRKIPIGTTGEIFWMGESAYGKRVGIKDPRGIVHWTAESNVRVDDAFVADHLGNWGQFEIIADRVAAASYPEARAALAARTLARSGEFLIDEFKQAMVEANETEVAVLAYQSRRTRQTSLMQRAARVAAYAARIHAVLALNEEHRINPFTAARLARAQAALTRLLSDYASTEA